MTRLSLGSGDHLRDVPSEGARRNYLAHLPNSYDAVAPVPVLVVLHGGGGSAAFASQVYGWLELSEREGCLAVFPEATAEDPTRPAAPRCKRRTVSGCDCPWPATAAK